MTPAAHDKLPVGDLLLPWKLVRRIRKSLDSDGDLERIFSGLAYFLLLGLVFRFMASFTAIGSAMGLLKILTTVGASYFFGLLVLSFVTLNVLCNVAAGPKSRP